MCEVNTKNTIELYYKMENIFKYWFWRSYDTIILGKYI